MVCYNRFLGCLLVGFFGLASFPVLAQNSAASDCAAFASAAQASCSSLPPPSGPGTYHAFHACSSYTVSSGVWAGKTAYAFVARCYSTTGSVNSNFSTLSFSVSSDTLLNRSCSSSTGNCSGFPFASGDAFGQSFIFKGDPEPVCPGPSAPEFTGWKAPTPNGTGEVCISGCEASIALQAPPAPLFSGIWTGQTCTVGPDTPAPIPSTEPELPDDPEDPGTGDPSDPEAPPNTGGGGFHCDQPPVCNADGVTCSMLYQQWRGRCDAQSLGLELLDDMSKTRDSIEGVGDKVDALGPKIDAVGGKVEALGPKIDAVGDKVDSSADRVVDGLSGVEGEVVSLRDDLYSGFSDGGVGDGADESALGGLVSSVSIGPGDLDDSGWGFPRTCPLWQDVSFPVGVSTITIPLSSMTLHCTIFEWTGLLILAFSSVVAARILLKGD